MKYNVDIMPRAAHDMMSIYHYITEEFGDIHTADKLLKDLQNAICNLDVLPFRCALRKYGKYAGKGYRQLFVKNFTIIYKADEFNKRVLIVAVRYTPSSF